jgi:hypothetical protein
MAVDRRTFLRTLGLSSLTLGLTMPTIAIGGENKHVRTTRDLSSVKVTGTVTGNGKGIAKVAVTDGINVVVTDDRGNYSLVTNATAEFVYISVPKGYAFEHEKGITNFFRRIASKNNTFRADFKLNKLTVDDSSHTFIVWADPQIQNADDATLLKTVSAPDTKQLVATLGNTALVHAFGCGDLVWDKFELFADYKEAVAHVGVPFFQVIGIMIWILMREQTTIPRARSKNNLAPRTIHSIAAIFIMLCSMTFSF